jgi:hypothetical protein
LTERAGKGCKGCEKPAAREAAERPSKRKNMNADSQSTKAIAEIIRTSFKEKPTFDASRGEENLTFRSDAKRYRVYVREDFEEDFHAMEKRYRQLLDDLPTALRCSKTGAVEVTGEGITEHKGPEF